MVKFVSREAQFFGYPIKIAPLLKFERCCSCDIGMLPAPGIFISYLLLVIGGVIW